MKKSSSKKGFSLIELIVVIAVIAAIAAVIVPSITNFNEEARMTAEARNFQLWNQTFLEARAAGATAVQVPVGAAVAVKGNVVDINAVVPVGGTDVTFHAEGFALTSATGHAGWTDGVGYVYAR